MSDGPDDKDEQREQEAPEGSRFPKPPDWNYKRNKTEDVSNKVGNYAGLATGIKYAYLLISPLLGGWFIGYWIDRGGNGNDGQVWGSIIGFFAGLAVVLVSVNRDEG